MSLQKMNYEFVFFKYVAVCENCVKAIYLDKNLENKQV